MSIARIFFLVITCMLFSKVFAEQAELSFYNFKKLIQYKKYKDYYLNQVLDQKVVISRQLLVKTHHDFEVTQFKDLGFELESAKALYIAKSFKYYLLSLVESYPIQQAIDRLSSVPGVVLVQPDILQLSTLKGGEQLSTKPLVQHSDHEHGNKLSNEEIARRLNKRYLRYLEGWGVVSLWKNTKGQGVRIAVIDDGFNLRHPALQHLKPIFSFDVNDRTENVFPRSELDSHGSKVAGVIFSSHQTGPIKGIAPQADFIAIRNSLTWTSQTLLSFQLAKLAKADVINCSWQSPFLVEPVADVVKDLALHGRNGKGTAVVFAAGNKGREILPGGSEAAIDKAIVVGARSIQPHILARSNYGKSVDMYHYGLRSTAPSSTGSGVSWFSGTSLAAAMTSGVMALLLAENPSFDLATLEKRFQHLGYGKQNLSLAPGKLSETKTIQ